MFKSLQIGDSTLQEIVTLLQSGIDNHGSQTLPVMPWFTYSRLLPQDATAIAMYLKSLPPVKRQVPHYGIGKLSFIIHGM